MKIDPELKAALIISASQQNRSLANLVETALFEYLAALKRPAARPEPRAASRKNK